MVKTTGPEGPALKETESAGQIQSHRPTELMAVTDQALSQPSDSDQSEEPDLEKALKEAEDNRDRWLRAVADLENFKKRSMQERTKLIKYKEEDLLRELLPIVDNLERALAHGTKGEKKDPVAQGVRMVMGMFREVLKKYGVAEIESLGANFNPQFHEAIAQEPVQNGPSNVVSKELEKGYMYKDRLLRPSKVVVSMAAK
ncbi:MAG: nucleotide exchange factor GrpE [Deltaproteobacteria bacterium]|nr:nucleotide exchange factor GrpE [Deltaproteobacteria bacterium]